MSNFFHYLTMDYLLQGAWLTLRITGYSFLLGLIGGVILAAIQLKRVPVLAPVVWVFVIVTRGTPVLVQLFFVYDILPTTGVRVSAFATAVFVLGINTSSYFSAVIRGAVSSVNRGQVLAAESLGMSPLVIAQRVVTPQAIRIALPGLANQVTVLILTSSLASVISVPELTLRSQEVSSSTFEVFSVFTASGLMYLVMTSAVAGIQLVLEDLLSLDPDKRQNGWVQRWARASRRLITQSTDMLWRRSRDVQRRDDKDAELAAPRLSLDDMLEEISSVHLSKDALTVGLDPVADSNEAETDEVPAVAVKNLERSYGARHVLRGVDLEVKRGEVVVIMGVSGCGKSTLLRSISRLEEFDSGSILLDGKPFGVGQSGRPLRGKALAEARARARIAMVFQHFELFTHMSARENVSASLRFVYRQQVDESNSRALTLLDAVGLGEHAEHLPAQLSGGQQQRTAIARGLAISPRLMLLDEPTSALDPLMVHEVLTVLRRLASLGMTMVIVTHEVEFARDVADQVVFMHEGRIVETGSPKKVLENPTQDATRAFLRILEK